MFSFRELGGGEGSWFLVLVKNFAFFPPWIVELQVFLLHKINGQLNKSKEATHLDSKNILWIRNGNYPFCALVLKHLYNGQSIIWLKCWLWTPQAAGGQAKDWFKIWSILYLIWNCTSYPHPHYSSYLLTSPPLKRQFKYKVEGIQTKPC